ncbi:MAG: hypothetical protein K5655_07990 [Lachnospiraceae bacterium]|nr:hypothetical protein [Lachnospiraceae bacterium]
MYRKSNASIITALLLFFALFLSGCAASEGSFEKAAQLYEEGKYREAEDYFEIAVEENPDDELIHIGHGFNLAMLGRADLAIKDLAPIYESRILNGLKTEKDIEFMFELGDALIDLYTDTGEGEKAAYVADQLAFFARSDKEKKEYQLKSAGVGVDIYKDDPDHISEYRISLMNVIDLSVYAGNEYVELVNTYRTGGEYREMLLTTDNMIIYMRGRSAHIDNFPAAICSILDAAEAASYVEDYQKTPQDYYDAAQEFITLAGDKGLTYEQKLRYRIVIAERMHQKDVAIRLLGVYLNHCKDDKKAIKEKLFLENRF